MKILAKAFLAVSLTQFPVEYSSKLSLYDHLADKYDNLNDGPATEALGINALRKAASLHVRGNVVETGAGTGIEIPYVDWGKVMKYTALDESALMLEKLKHRMSLVGKGPIVEIVQGNVENIPVQDGSADTVVDTFSMCVYQDPSAAVKEMSRIVKPDTGRVILLENTLSSFPPLALFQKLSSRIVASVSKGCRWDVDVPQLAKRAGLIEINSERKGILLDTIVLYVYKKVGHHAAPQT